MFWKVMEAGYVAKRLPFAHVLKAFRKHFPDAPESSQPQTVKRIVDARFQR